MKGILLFLAVITATTYITGCCGTIPVRGSDTAPPEMVYRPIGARPLIEDRDWYESPARGRFVHAVNDADNFHVQVAFEDPGMIRSIRIIAIGGLITPPTQPYRLIVETVNFTWSDQSAPSDRLTVNLDDSCPDDEVNIVFKLEKRPEFDRTGVNVAIEAIDYSGNVYGDLSNPNGQVTFDFF